MKGNARRLIITEWKDPVKFTGEKSPFHFQFEAAKFALSRNNSYLALDPGLGKTIVAALIAYTLKPRRIVYCCPPGLMANVKNEFDIWAKGVRIEIVPDTKLDKLKDNYLIDLLFVDEAHRFKNEKSKRTHNLFYYYCLRSTRCVFLSGTPLPNRPMELYPVLSHCAPNTIAFMNKFEFGRKYCAGHRNNWGWDFSGASNMKELATRIKGSFLIRMKKKDVLKELPEKFEDMVILAEDLPPLLAALDQKILKEQSPEDLMKDFTGEEHISTYRKELGKLKVKLAVDYIKNILNDTDESVLVFAVHKDVISKLAENLSSFDPLIITGQTPSHLRQGIVTDFQTSKTKRLFIGNIQASGVGFTLTKASRVVFVEFAWTPADNEQASDRAHRIGQQENVTVTYLVFKNSVDRAVLETIMRKRKVIGHI